MWHLQHWFLELGMRHHTEERWQGYHTQRKWDWHGSPFTTFDASFMLRAGIFLQGLRHSLMVDLFQLFWEGWVSIFYIHILKNHVRKYLFRFHGICCLLCRDISLAAKSFFLNRSKCQVWSTGTAKGFALYFLTQVNLANFQEVRWL